MSFDFKKIIASETFKEELQKMGRWVGAAIDIGTALHESFSTTGKKEPNEDGITVESRGSQFPNKSPISSEQSKGQDR